jgi:N-hydroxyarylamine O-acetyltransferase
MTVAMDLDSYFRRIGYAGPRTATLETLRALHALHPQAIPFENLTPFSGEEVALDFPSIERKLVQDQRGGYCFEQNGLFMEVLSTLGFRVSGLSGRVIWNRPEDAITARGHMLLRVEVEGDVYLADVGFGGQVLTAPLLLREDVEQATPHGPFRLVRGSDGDLRVQSLVRTDWRSLYRFDLTPAFPVDYEVGNYYLSTHPQSHFRLGLLVARVGKDRRFGLHDRRLTVRETTGTSTERMLQTPSELRQVLEETFGIRVPEKASVTNALQRLF